MWASFQARSQFSQRRRDGRLHGSVRISLSLLKELSTAHSSGSVVSNAQPARNTWDKTGTVERGRGGDGTGTEERGRVSTAIYSSTRSRRVTRRNMAATVRVRKNIATPIADA
ncbi:hypothetical protein Ade02nite_08460 [Paractinoplanes deccanensis]|uniref:Uncharacterized protein n=1 Tax=Paractinoplanes deccanensis TaxID=113561 RepID=A0ABQ3XWT4_9ACTN|nr:hypothetical protein Ade02nite_08460 [Actinoplanes deccanensis]